MKPANAMRHVTAAATALVCGLLTVGVTRASSAAERSVETPIRTVAISSTSTPVPRTLNPCFLATIKSGSESAVPSIDTASSD
jgi:hypothetical protein